MRFLSFVLLTVGITVGSQVLPLRLQRQMKMCVAITLTGAVLTACWVPISTIVPPGVSHTCPCNRRAISQLVPSMIVTVVRNCCEVCIMRSFDIRRTGVSHISIRQGRCCCADYSCKKQNLMCDLFT